ncbi:MAG: aspartyl protease [Chloroflexi bacterium]|nr:aspartyl protease [Chloroflexota bacterium]
MGFVHVNVGISNPERIRLQEDVELPVDSGAMLSLVPRRILEVLGVSPIGRRRFRGFGGIVERDTGVVVMSFDGAVAGVTVICGEEDDPSVMGVTALETLGYQVDPDTGELSPTEMLQL